MTIWQQRKEKMRITLTKKAKEYAIGKDRLHNFRRAAVVHGCTMKEACMGMALKHIVSVIDMLEDERLVTTQLVDEKIGDALNYCVLIYACDLDMQMGRGSTSSEEFDTESLTPLIRYMDLYPLPNIQPKNIVSLIMEQWKSIQTRCEDILPLMMWLICAEYKFASEHPDE